MSACGHGKNIEKMLLKFIARYLISSYDLPCKDVLQAEPG
jgi:hypothetical protein